MTIRQFFYNLKEVQPVKVELAENEYRKLEEQMNGALPAEHISGGSSSVQTVPPVLIQCETAKENYEREKKEIRKNDKESRGVHRRIGKSDTTHNHAAAVPAQLGMAHN